MISLGEKQWRYIGVSTEQTEPIDAIIEFARRRGIYRSRAEIVAEAIADYLEKSENQQKIRSVRQ